MHGDPPSPGRSKPGAYAFQGVVPQRRGKMGRGHSPKRGGDATNDATESVLWWRREGLMGALASVDVDKHDVIVSRNPATGEVLGEIRESTAAEIRDAVSRARGAQAAWGALPVKDRCTRVAR